jgi:DNA helicase-2/ATP-dependent DNA helicase PcrA
METLERMALSSGMSTWDAMGRAIEDKLLPPRTLMALGSFTRLIEDARAMLGPGFAEKLAGDIAADGNTSLPSGIAEDASFEFGTDAEEEAGVAAGMIEDTGGKTSFDTSFNFGFDFGPSEEISTIAPVNATDSNASHGIDAANFNPFAPVVLKKSAGTTMARAVEIKMEDDKPAFRKPGGAATLPELIKFLNDRSGYIRALEEEATPESFSRIENLKELANAAQDAQERGETLHEFLDHAALVSDADGYSEDAKVTLMTLHAAKGLEFPLVFLTGMEEGLFPHSRTLTDPTGLEEERRLCYVGMTRAMDTLVMTRARYRRRYGSDMPEASIASRFLEEVPARLVEDLGSPPARPQFSGSEYGSGYGGAYATPYPKANRFDRSNPENVERHYSYEDEDQSGERGAKAAARATGFAGARRLGQSGKTEAPGQSIDNIASFFAARGQKITRPKLEVEAPAGKTGLKQGARVRHPKYGEGTVFRREGDGDDAKITVQFQQHGVKKLVEKFAQLERL